MSISNTSKKISKLGLPVFWQAYIFLHAFFALSILLISDADLISTTTILLKSLILIGVFAGFKYHKHIFYPWGFLLVGLLFIEFSVIAGELTNLGAITLNSNFLAGIHEVGIILISIFSLTFMLHFEKEFKLVGFTVDYSLIVISFALFILLISPSFIDLFLYEISFIQQMNIVNLFAGLIFTSMAILNHFLCRNILLKDIVRIMMILFFTLHFALEVVNTAAHVEVGTFQSQLSWALYHLAGTCAIAFIFLENMVIDYRKKTVTNLSTHFMWSASIMAIVAIPLGVIVRDRLHLPPVSSLIIGIATFTLSSIVIWRFQKLIKRINTQRNNLKTIAYTDPLTGLLNYHGYVEKLSDRNIENMFIISINVEDFKSINDLRGRDFGDQVLKSLAKRLKKTPGIILASRTASDNFQAVFRSPEENIPVLIKKIQEHLGVWDTVLNRRIAVPLTYGASHSINSVNPETLARQAEQALRTSRNGHTDFTLYTKEKAKDLTLDKYLPRHELREILQKSVDDDYLPVHFQPIYDLQDGKLKALELLIRVESEDHGLLLPGQFLEQAKSYGLLTSLTQVCINMVAKHYDELPSVIINVNVPPYMLDNDLLLNDFIACFEKAKLPMGRFCIEVTEDGDIPTDHLIPSIKRLKSHGFKIAMDDFGTGYSSLSRLSALPVDIVKIDRSLLLAASAGDKSILESAISLTKRLGATTVVEGVETIEQLALIRRLGADSVQGFLLSKPVDIKKTALLSINVSDIIPHYS